MRKLTLATTALAAFGLIGIASACSASPAAVPHAAVQHAQAASPPPAAVSTQPDGSPANPLHFGQTSLSGLDVTVSQPVAYTPSPEAVSMSTQSPAAVVSTVTVVNHGSWAVDLGTDVWATATDGSTDAPSISDSGIGSDAKVLPGQTFVFKVAFGVPTGASQLNVDVSHHTAPLSVDTADAFWSGSISA